MNFRSLPFLILILTASLVQASDVEWPDLSSPAGAVGGGARDAAVVIGIENYFAVPGIPGAKTNAKQWYEYLTETRGVPPRNVKLLTNEDGAKEQILEAAHDAADRAGEGGNLWFIFVGHGAPSSDGKDGLLVGVDAQQTAQSLQARSVRRGELLKVLGTSKASSVSVVLDACFSGRGPDGGAIAKGLQPLQTVMMGGPVDPRIVVLTAAKGNQFAGALPGANRPAFSYLVLGGLRGWAADKKGAITAKDLWRYATDALDATLRGRKQEPDIIGKEGAVMGTSAGEKGPSLAKLATATAGGALEFKVSALPEVPTANLPSQSALGGLPRVHMPGAMGQAEGIDFGAVDVDALGRYDEVVVFEKSEASGEDKAAKWRALGEEVKTYADVAAKRAAEWEDYSAQDAFNAVVKNDKGEDSPRDKAAKWLELAGKYPKYAQTAKQRAQDWERYAKELEAAEAVRHQREQLMAKDWAKLGKLFSYSVVSEADKRKFAATFIRAYGKDPKDNPYTADLAPYLPTGTVTVPPRETAARPQAGPGGVEWVSIPGGSFMMGSEENPDEQPRRRVVIRTFQMAKSAVTNKQYKVCVDAGACDPQSDTCLDGAAKGANAPAVCVNWDQARKFSEWAGGRLPTEAEWEYAARSAGKEFEYPWGNEAPTCAKAVISGCGREAAVVCAKIAGNSAQGLCDMAGNVWQWTQDWYHKSYTGAPTDGAAWEKPAGVERVSRGGSWYDNASFARTSYRNYSAPSKVDASVGFRPARYR